MNANNNSTGNSITHAFQQIEIALNQKLKRQGYKIAHEERGKHDFTSMHIIWLSDADAWRLSWDDKEQQFVLEFSDALPLSPIPAWNAVISAPYDPHKYDEHYIVTIATEFVDSFK